MGSRVCAVWVPLHVWLIRGVEVLDAVQEAELEGPRLGDSALSSGDVPSGNTETRG